VNSPVEQDIAEVEDEDVVDPQVQAQVDVARADVDARVAKDPELVYGDVVELVALELPVEAAVQLCAQTIEFIPDTIRKKVFEAEHEETIRKGAAINAEKDAAAAKLSQRSARAAATRARTLKAEAEVESAAVKSRTCPVCFQLRAASGVCGCD
jgi:hypothetical protein